MMAMTLHASSLEKLLKCQALVPSSCHLPSPLAVKVDVAMQLVSLGEDGTCWLCSMSTGHPRRGSASRQPARAPSVRSGRPSTVGWRSSSKANLLLLAVIFKVLLGQRPKPQAEPLALQDLLRKIPSKLLDIQLYKEWISALEKTRGQQRLATLKEVACKLPEANLLLLRHLLSLLSNISSNMATSKMTAGNQAICLGPSLLSPPHELPSDDLTQEMQTICCVHPPATASQAQLCCSEGPGCLFLSAKPLSSSREELSWERLSSYQPPL
ncbi:hypothetical protein AAES_00256 [Amazona aestiva]|uniref:Rho-GAP domain-containing protein n=1 Tax=Amazona aestiva TaxID=12930 RepID=A0A0Q3XB10_AMAAE|nr:hypothetical protein AAES_00256 [Amazona aestiva]